MTTTPKFTIVPAPLGYRVLRVQLPDATAPAILTAVPVLAWRVSHATGEAEPVTARVDFDTSDPECGIESNAAPGVISRGVIYPTLMLFIDSRRDAIRESARRAAPTRLAAALDVRADPIQGSEYAITPDQIELFFAHLAETGNASASAALADISRAYAYKLRKTDAAFAARWVGATEDPDSDVLG